MIEQIVEGLSLDDLLSIEDQSGAVSYPETVPNRVLHIDGDFVAYMASFDETITFQMMCHNTDVMLETLRLLAGAESICVHLTPHDSDKGKRYELAVLKEYQGNREGKVKPQNLERIRLYMANAHKAILHYDQEADDGLAQANYNAIKAGHRELSVIVSKDKDLMIVPGLHLDWDTAKLFDVNTFGDIELKGSKVKGTGEKFFWCQMLMGDTADNIPGLPKISGKDMHKIKPNQKYNKLLEIIAKYPNTEKAAKAQKEYDSRPPYNCGASTTYAIMKDVKTARQAYKTVRQLYINYFKQEEVIGLKGEPLKWYELFISNGRLLWMRRDKDYDDFMKYVKEIIHDAESKA